MNQKNSEINILIKRMKAKVEASPEARSVMMYIQMLTRDFLLRGGIDEKFKKQLKENGYPEDQWTNVLVFIVALFNKAVEGNLRAAKLFLEISGLTGDEIRKDAEMRRKDRESRAKIQVMRAKAHISKNKKKTSDGDCSIVLYDPAKRKELFPDE